MPPTTSVFRCLLLLVATILVAVAGPVQADTTVHKNARSTKQAFYESYLTEAAGPRFYFRLTGAKGMLEGEQAAVAAADLLTIEFRDPGDEGKTPAGRVANITMADGKVVAHATIESWQDSRSGASFRVRKMGVPPGGKAVVLPASQVRSIEFAPGPIEMLNATALTDKTRRVGRRGDLADVRYQPPPDPNAPAADSEPTGPMSSDEQFSKLIGADKVYGDNNPLGSGKPKKKSGMFDIGNARTGAAIEALGYLIVFGLLGGIMLLTFIVGTFVLLFSARNEGIKDLTVPRAIATSALLAFVPPGLFFICLVIPFPFCSLKLTAGFFLWWLSAKIIVSGMLEVMEGKAVDILISFYAILVCFGCVFWIWATWR